MSASKAKPKSSASEELAGDDKPTGRFILKWLGIFMGLAVLTMVVVGLFLPRQWEVETSVEIEADQATVHALVSDLQRWDSWMFPQGEDAPGPELTIAGEGVGSSVSWKGSGSRGRIEITDIDPAEGIAWEGQIETDEVNNHGRIRYEQLEGGVVRVTLRDTGTLPPVIGGYGVPAMNAGLRTHFSEALGRLEQVAEAQEPSS